MKINFTNDNVEATFQIYLQRSAQNESKDHYVKDMTQSNAFRSKRQRFSKASRTGRDSKASLKGLITVINVEIQFKCIGDCARKGQVWLDIRGGGRFC